MKFVIIIISLFLFICNCRSIEYRLIETNSRSDLKKIRLGLTNYYLKLSDTFELTQVQGKEGQIGYDIIPKDTSSSMFGFIEIDLGQRLRNRIGDWGTLKEKVQSKLLNHQAVWKIYQTETGYYVAETLIKNISSEVSSKKINEIDSLISIITTLSIN